MSWPLADLAAIRDELDEIEAEHGTSANDVIHLRVERIRAVLAALSGSERPARPIGRAGRLGAQPAGERVCRHK